jgi:hypothetical protein
MRPWLVFTLLGLVVGASGARAAEELPIVDTHLHYSQDAWTAYPTPSILTLLTRAGIIRAFVSSTPDDGTVRLYEAAPDRVVPVLRPYREPGDQGAWHRDPGVVAYLEGRIRRGIYRGIGEFHLYGRDAQAEVVRQVAELAARNGLFLHCHCDVEALEIVLGLVPGVRVLWAHAGMSSGPEVVGPLIDRHAGLTVELALRSDVATGGTLDAAWRALFLRHPDRFMVGADTWAPSRWSDLAAITEATRGWLRQLPPEVARRIARENAERLAGVGR